MINITMNDVKVRNMITGLRINIPKAIARGCDKAVKRIAKSFREYIDSHHGFTGELSSGTYSKRLNKNVWAVLSLDYFKYLEKGSRPHFVPKTPKLVAWANTHGFTFKELKKQIARYGTRAYKFSDPIILKEISNTKMKVEKEINRTVRSKGKR
jgi:hypothetical protein